MKISSLLGTLAIGTLVSACSGNRGSDSDPLYDDGAPNDNAQQPSGHASDEPRRPDAAKGNDTSEPKPDDAPGSAPSDDDPDDSGEEAAGSGGIAGMPASGGSNATAGSAGTGQNAASGGSASTPNTGGSSSSEVAGTGGSGGGATNGGGASSGGSGGTGGSGGRATTGGSGGSTATGGTGGGTTTGGSGGGTTTGGSGGGATTGGSGGGATTGGSGGGATTGGSGGTTTGGSGGGATAGGSETGGGAGSGGTGGGATALDPQYLYESETFGGNGRTCATCHTASSGTLNPEQVQALYASDPTGPLFRVIDSDDGVGNDYTQLRARATFRVTIDLPAGVHLAADASATSLTFRRGVPSTINTPALDPVLMWDGRQPDLTSQALSAALGHAEATVTPTAAQLQLITQFEQSSAFFSSDLLRAYAQGGATPTWPAGVTEAEQRGRRWFAQDAAAPRFNICGMCHGGPMLNETQSNSGLPVGKHFQTVNVSEFNTLGNPTHELTFPDPKQPGKTVTVVTPDPGRALITGDVRDANFFKIPTLWGVKNTAPYFHDNSATTLEQLVDHYERHLATFLPRNRSYPNPHVPTAQDKADIVAYLKLL